MSSSTAVDFGRYALATGAAAVGRLDVLHRIYSPVAREALAYAGLKEGMKVADFGCGSGAMTRTLAAMVGASGSVVGIDASGDQVAQASALCQRDGVTNAHFLKADATATGLPRNSFDFAYCRFLLLHLTDPAACLREMRDILKEGGVLFVEDGDLASATSIPRTALDSFAELFSRLGPLRGVNYSISNELGHLLADAGLCDINLRVHHPAQRAGDTGLMLKWSVEEAGQSFVDAGLITEQELGQRLSAMEAAMKNPDVLALAPRMYLVWGVKAAQSIRQPA